MRFFLLYLMLMTSCLSAQSVMDANSTLSDANKTLSADTGDEDEVFNEEDGFEEDAFVDDSFSEEFASKSKEEPFDPLSGYNRMMTGFNDGLYEYLLKPVLFRGYNYIPREARVSVNNFFENLYYPVSVVNNILQLKVKNTATETVRFAINSTLGVLGLFDPAKSWFGFEPHQEDFGQTLGYYGVGGGFPIVMPFFGPTNLRDLSGDFIDFYVNPLYYVDVRKYNIVDNKYQGWALITYKEFNYFSLYNDEYENIRKDALDLYPFMRDLYEQHRQKQIEE